MADAKVSTEKMKESEGSLESYVVFDCETTGLDDKNDKIVQLSMLKSYPDGREEIFNHYFNPKISRQKQLDAYKVHNISPDVLLKEKPFETYTEKILEFLKDVRYLIGYNVCFDWNFLVNAFKNLDVSTAGADAQTDWEKKLKENQFTLIDTHKMCIVAFPKLKRYRLVDIADHLKIESQKQPVVHYSVSSPKKCKPDMVKIETGSSNTDGLHDAMMDVLVTNEIFRECIETIQKSADEKTYQSIFEDKRYVCQIISLEIIDRGISLDPLNETEMAELDKIVENAISTLIHTRGMFLKDLSVKNLQDDIAFLNSRKNINNQRESHLRKLIMDDKIFEEMDNEIGKSKSKPSEDLEDYFKVTKK